MKQMKSEKLSFSILYSRAPLNYKHPQYIPSTLSQCGKTAYLKRGQDMKVCQMCGMYHKLCE